ncbi:MAG: right-handed parallel beta-helix repeat-containing protein [Acidobacteria bacterium]|nr:right-handed parallel beta-helix repeat-containing protein [Acidobacteriota bacterium]
MKRRVSMLFFFGVIALAFSASKTEAQVACDTTVTAPSSIQTAVDAVTDVNLDGERVVCLDDSGGSFSQSVVLDTADSGITLTAEPGDSPTLDGSSLGSADAISLLAGVSDVTIESLEITGYGPNPCCGLGMGIQAWNNGTSNITVQNNHIHDNTGNAILVGNEGTGVHTGWLVANNVIAGTGYYLLELTNCEGCTIIKNQVTGGFLGIVVQARNTSTTGGGSGDVVIDGVSVLHNTVNNSVYGVYVLSFTGHPWLFTPITGATTLLSSVNISNNTIVDSTGWGILFWAYNGAATAENGRIMHNEITCSGGSNGVGVLQSGYGQTGTVKNVKVVNNNFSGCDPNVTNTGQDTKLPRGLGPY